MHKNATNNSRELGENALGGQENDLYFLS